MSVMNESRARDIIGLTTEKLDIDLIRKLYKKLALIYHPDKGGNEETFKRLNAAYEYLLSRVEPAKPEPRPSRPRPSRPEPAKSSRPEPAKSEPAKPEPAKSSRPEPRPTREDILHDLFGTKKCLYVGCTSNVDGIEAAFGKMYCPHHSKSSVRKTSNEACEQVLKSGQRCKKKALLGHSRCILHYVKQ